MDPIGAALSLGQRIALKLTKIQGLNRGMGRRRGRLKRASVEGRLEPPHRGQPDDRFLAHFDPSPVGATSQQGGELPFAIGLTWSSGRCFISDSDDDVHHGVYAKSRPIYVDTVGSVPQINGG